MIQQLVPLVLLESATDRSCYRELDVPYIARFTVLSFVTSLIQRIYKAKNESKFYMYEAR